MKSQLAQWKRDPVAFITSVLINPETNRPFDLYPEQIEFLRRAFTPLPDGSLPYPEIIFSAPKKSGKTLLAALIILYVIVCLGGPYAEGYCIANDFDQAQGRVFQAVCRICQASPMLRDAVKIQANRLTFLSTGATITAIASEYSSAAGANPTITVFDELWGYVSERSHRLFDEMIPVPTRTPSVRLTVTYAGFSGESDLLESLYNRALQGEQVAPSLYRDNGLIAYWTHAPVAPWQTPEWIEQMRGQLRPNAFARMIENRWVSSETTFISAEEWDGCVNSNCAPIPRDASLPVFVGVDASVKRDSTAIVACSYDKLTKKVQLIAHRVFQPAPDDPINFEAQVEYELLNFRQRYAVKQIVYDPYQMVAVAQRLSKRGLPMAEFTQTLPNLTEASNNLYELIKARNLVVYPDAAMRKSVLQTVASESARGWKLAKEKQSHKIDVVVALAMAALAAVQQKGVYGPPRVVSFPGFQELPAEYQPWNRAAPDGLPTYDVGFCDRDGKPLRG